MSVPSPSEFQPYRKVQANAEADLRAILDQTARAIQKRIRLLPVGIGGQVRAAQLRVTLAAIKRMQSAMWTTRVQPLVIQGVQDAEKAAESAIETMTRVAYAALSEPAAEELIRGLRLAAEGGLKNDQARRARELSSRVYKLRALHEGKVEEVIRQGLLSQLTPKELADSVYKYVSPTTPGGSSYAAMRLARTEINNAFHERQLLGAERPGVRAVKWNLSGSHRVPDLCNVYAVHGGNGHWAVGNVPDKPHPQCFCYLTYVTQTPAEFQKALERGDFDAEIDRRTRENMARLGQKVGATPPPKVEPTPVTPKVASINKAIIGDYLKTGNSDQLESILRGGMALADQASGVIASVKEIDFGGRPGKRYVELAFDFRDKDGKKIGSAERQIFERNGKVFVEHSEMTLRKDFQGAGFASRWNGQNEELYRSMGVDSIELLANIDVGGYAWARQGYDFQEDADLRRLGDSLSRRISEFDPKVQEEARQLVERARGNGKRPLPLEFAMLGWEPGLKMWPGKEFLLDSRWKGVKKL